MKAQMATLGAIVLVAASGCSSAVYVRPAAQPVAGPAVSPAASAPAARPVVTTTRIVLTGDQVTAVRAYFERSTPSRGRGRSGGLPPGIARNLERGKPLPPGIAKQYLPSDLVAVLPALDRSLEYVVAAGKLLLVDAATQVVRDVLIDVLFD